MVMEQWSYFSHPHCTEGYSIQLIPHPKLCVRVKYYIVHMYSMPYYTYGSTANFLFLGPTALIYIYISKERRCNKDLHGVGNKID